MKRLKYIGEALKHHLPFSVLSVTFGLILVGLLTFLTEALKIEDYSELFEELFHVFHPSHILFSTIATTAMFWKNEKKFLKALIIGIIGSIGICGISDIIIPYVAGSLLGVQMELHICIVKHPQITIPFLFLGLLLGFLAPETIEKHEGVIFSHSLHVFISASASIIYLVSFGLFDWIHRIGVILIYMVIAVVLPCCTSDIIFPLLLVAKRDEKH